MEYCLVLCTCPEGEPAESLARFLVEEHLAACVNILPGLTSVYSWEGRIASEREALLLIKTEAEAYSRLELRLRDRHPYELPEIIAVSIERGLPDYLQWISQCLSSDS
ncbi:MAG: divalent-cation tolerance protein CutA [Methylococcaceae bacterium]|nr:divalent-cation tolerance protein CutA [Methylococcaceae bacterium]